jgi:hypothetical protein
MKLLITIICGLLAPVVMSACDKNSWVADAGRDDYTKTANGTQVVFGTRVPGPASILIVAERKQSWTSTLDPSVTYKDVLDLNPKFADYFNETIVDSTELDYSVAVQKGTTAYVGFTPFLRCSRGESFISPIPSQRS